jgi:hypothetical protein
VRREHLKAQWVVLGAGLEPACLSAYAPQTYVSAISPPEHLRAGKLFRKLLAVASLALLLLLLVFVNVIESIRSRSTITSTTSMKLALIS